MKKFLLPLVALSIILTSCSRDNDDVINNPITNPVVQGDLLAEITTNTSHSIGTGRFTYNGDKLQSSASLDGDMSYTYIEDQIRYIRRSKGPMGIWDINYTYNPDGTLKQVDQIHNYEYRSHDPARAIENRKEIATREYTYVGNNTINVKSIAKTYRENSNEVFSIFIAEYTFTINNGNIVKKIEKSQFKEGNDTSSFMNNPTTTTITYTFDDKINPLHNIKGLSAIAIDFHTIDNKDVFSMYVNKNNILEKRVDIDGRSIEQTTNQYEYNSKGYPTKLTSTIVNRITDTTVYNYIYK